MFKLLTYATALILIMVTLLAFTVKYLAFYNAIKVDSVWNKNKTCQIVAYSPNYKKYGVIGKVASLFGSDAFYSVYNLDNERIKTSAFYFWQNEFSYSMAAEWIGARAMYPTNDGWNSWKLPQCSI